MMFRFIPIVVCLLAALFTLPREAAAQASAVTPYVCTGPTGVAGTCITSPVGSGTGAGQVALPTSVGPYPTSTAAVTGKGTGTTGAVTATLVATASTTYLCHFDVSAIGGTAAVGPIVISGLLGGPFTYQLSSSAIGVILQENFSPCIPASAANTNIVITTTADATATAVDVNASGFQ